MIFRRRIVTLAFLSAIAFIGYSKIALGAEPSATFTNVAYGPDPREVLDFWKAPSDKPTPLVVYIHGGGFTAGDKSDILRGGGCDHAAPEGRHFIREASITHSPRMAVLLDIMRDCARQQSTFCAPKTVSGNIDNSRVAAYGSSAGAGASLWLAFHNDIAGSASPRTPCCAVNRMRPQVVGALSTQSTYDIRQWGKILRTVLRTIP